MRWPDRIWVIGCGNMGGAILQAWLDHGAPVANISIIDPNPFRLPEGLSASSSFPTGGVPDLVLLATKPQILGDVAPLLRPHIGSHSKLVSILAGVGTETLEHLFPQADTVMRLVPNMAVTVGKSPMILYSRQITDKSRLQMDDLFAPLGFAEWVADEDLLHIATALSGSGPAFLFRFIDGLAAGGRQMGLPEDQAARLALAMVEGAALLAARSAEDPGTLADQVASPGGTTRKGLDVMDADGRVDGLLLDVLEAAATRSREMAEEAKA
ncbi:pyrroline-5-carboxylate reductase [Sphingomonadales bacterium EhC05]|nr:pyrroline-5-carboxylate reductase [Sphingomonadales bacterium EhC05]